MTTLIKQVEYPTLLVTIASAFLGLLLGTSAPAALADPAAAITHNPGIPLGMWEEEAGDRLIIDTKENKGYLIHEDGTFTDFDVVTGQRRNVYYIGRYYNATTPTRTWRAQSVHIKGDRITYGKTGRFLRLYWDDERTPYGIHAFGYEDRMFSQDTRFQSMGCIIVRESVLNIIETTYETNGQMLDVVTTYGLEQLEEQVDRLVFESADK